jgi:hypothetical protein
VDLVKAYDRVDRQVLWDVLERRGVPERMARLIRNMHEGATAQVRVDGQLSTPFVLEMGLKQGSAIASLLFNIYLGAIIEEAHKEMHKHKDLGLKLVPHKRKGGVLIRSSRGPSRSGAQLAADLRYPVRGRCGGDSAVSGRTAANDHHI